VLQTRRSKLVSSEKSALFENPIEKLFENEHSERTKVKYIERVSLGLDLTLDTWYASPYPQEYEKVEHIYVCHKCLKYMRKHKTLLNHQLDDCSQAGTIIYEQGGLSVHRVLGLESKLYCQNLSLFAKLFIDHKVLYFDIKDYEYFVLSHRKDSMFVGYFSRLRNVNSLNNLSCIVVLPPF
jgi:hypothetical protein